MWQANLVERQSSDVFSFVFKNTKNFIIIEIEIVNFIKFSFAA